MGKQDDDKIEDHRRCIRSGAYSRYGPIDRADTGSGSETVRPFLERLIDGDRLLDGDQMASRLRVPASWLREQALLGISQGCV
jgi:hypothetical protein